MEIVALISELIIIVAIILTPFALYRGFRKKNWLLMKITGLLFFVFVVAVVFGAILVDKGYWTIPPPLSATMETSYLVNYKNYEELPINLIPMYGKLEGRIKTEDQKRWDDDFINLAIARNIPLEDTSEQIIEVAWSFVKNDDLDTAMKRFNQAWLLDATNSGSYYGFIYLLERTGRYDDAEEIRVYTDKLGIRRLE